MMTAEEKLTQLPKNTVVCYKGGGYDGCFWEYNYAYCDAEGKFHDIFSSGYKGITDGDTLLKEINEGRDPVDLYDMSDEEDRQRFVEAEAIHNSLRVAGFFAEHDDFGVDFKLKCSRCECWLEPEGFQPHGFHGAGGIMIVADDMICPECYCGHSCYYCGEYTEGELTGEVTKDDGTTIELNGDACEWCADDIKEGRKEK